MSRRIRFLTIPDCLLCEEAWLKVQRVAPFLGVAVDRVDLADLPASHVGERDRYLERVPVLIDRGRVVAEGAMSTGAVMRAVAGAWLPRRAP